MKVIFYLVVWVLTVEAIRELGPKSTRVLFSHVNMIVELTFNVIYFSMLLKPNKRIILILGSILFSTAFILNSEGLSSGFWHTKNYNYCVAGNICITAWSCIFLYELIYKPLNYTLKHDGNFWIICGNLLFFPGTVLLYGLSNYLGRENPELAHSLQIINHSLNLLLYFFYVIALFQHNRQKHKNSFLSNKMNVTAYF